MFHRWFPSVSRRASLVATQLSCAAVASILLATAAAPARAAEFSVEVETEGAVAISVDVARFASTKMGGLLIDAGTKLAAQQMEKDPDEAIEALVKSLGFDPLKEGIQVQAIVQDIEDPIAGLQVSLRLDNTTGNLEGLLLAAPEYSAIQEGGQTIHKVSLDDAPIFIAFTTDSGGKKHVFAAGNKQDVVHLIENVDKGGPQVALNVDEREFAVLEILSLPEDVAEEPPISNISQLVKQASLRLGESESDLVIRAELRTENEEQATQLQQLTQGVVAMVGLFKEEIRSELGDEETAKMVLPILEKIMVNREGKKISVEIAIPEQLVIQFLREEADLPL